MASEVDFSGKTAVIYTRVSTEEQARGQSLTVQRETCERWCADHGVTVAQVFDEGHHTGTTLMRPALGQLVLYCNTQDVALAVAYDATRFSRNDELDTLKRMLPHTTLVYVDFGTSDDDFVTDVATSIMGKFAKQEVSRSRKKTSESLHKRMDQGYHIARPVKFAIREDVPKMPVGRVREKPYQVYDDVNGIIRERRGAIVKTETELWFMADNGYSVEQCAREWQVPYSTLREYLLGDERFDIPPRLSEYRAHWRASGKMGPKTPYKPQIEVSERMADGKVAKNDGIDGRESDGKEASA